MSPPLLFVSGEYPPDVGGLGDYTMRLSDALACMGWSSRVLSRRDVRRWDARSLIWLARTAPRAGIAHLQYQAGAFDLLGDVCLMPSLLRALRPKVRVVTTFHDTRVPYLFPKASALRARAVQLLAKTSHAVIAASSDDLQALGGPSSRHHHVPIGSNLSCNPPPFYDRAAFRASLGLAPESQAIAYFGMLNASKGVSLVLDTFAQLARETPEVRLLLLGAEVGASDPTDAQTAAQFDARIAAFGDRIIRTGWLEPRTLSAHLLAADVALLPYADGASPRRGSLLACAEHGLPIVSTLPAAPEVASAVVATQPDAEHLAAAIRRIAIDRAERERLGSVARNLAQAVAWPGIAQAHVAIYSRLLYS